MGKHLADVATVILKLEIEGRQTTLNWRGETVGFLRFTEVYIGGKELKN